VQRRPALICLIYPDAHFPFAAVRPAKPRNKGQRLGLLRGWRAIVLPQRLLLRVRGMAGVTLRLEQHLVGKNPLAFQELKFAVSGQDQVMQPGTVIGLFETVDQRPALDRHFPGLLAHLRIAVYPAYRHRQS